MQIKICIILNEGLIFVCLEESHGAAVATASFATKQRIQDKFNINKLGIHCTRVGEIRNYRKKETFTNTSEKIGKDRKEPV